MKAPIAAPMAGGPSTSQLVIDSSRAGGWGMLAGGNKNVDALAEKRAAAQGKTHIDVGFWGGAIPGNTGDLRSLHDDGVFGFKCFLADSGVPEFPPLDAAQLRDHLEEIARIGSLMIVHAEDPETLAAAPSVGGRAYSDFLASRPDESEVAAIALLIDTVRATGARAHILHLSSAKALPQIRAAKAEGLALTVETCPHYLSFTAEAIRDGNFALFIARQHRPGQLIAAARALARAGASRGGTGLGLALVSKIAADHGAGLRLDSRPGRTVIRLSLPLAGKDTPWTARS